MILPRVSDIAKGDSFAEIIQKGMDKNVHFSEMRSHDKYRKESIHVGTYCKAVLYQSRKGTRFSRPFFTRSCLQGIVCYTIFVFGRNISDVFAYAKVMLLTSFVMMLLPLVAMM